MLMMNDKREMANGIDLTTKKFTIRSQAEIIILTKFSLDIYLNEILYLEMIIF